MKDFFQSQLEELRENKLRAALLVIILVATIIYAVVDFDSAEEIVVTDEPQKISQAESPAKTTAPTSDKVKPVIGANNDEIFIQNPFQNPAPAEIPAEKVLPPAAPVIVAPPPVEEVPKPPEIKFVLRATAIGDAKTAIVEKVDAGKVETMIVTIGDKLNEKIISEITDEYIVLNDGDKLFIQ